MESIPDVATMNISDQERLDLRKLARQNEATDYTDSIRRVKHSRKLAEDLLTISTRANEGKPLTTEEGQIACSFLHGTYPDIFQRAISNQLDMKLMSRFLLVLKRIEDGELESHEGGLLIGKLLKSIYIDSALKRSATSDEENTAQPEQDPVPQKRTCNFISWKEFKNVHLQ
jgi:hypothetical protein